MTNHISTPWHVDPLSATIYASDVPKGPARVADMRGWGYLTGKGDGALGLSQDEAIDIQRANAAFIVKAVNNHNALVEALEGLIEAVRRDCDIRDKGISGYTGARLADAKDALNAFQQRTQKEPLL